MSVPSWMFDVDWTSLAAFSATAVAFYATWKTSKNAEANLKFVGLSEAAKLKERRLYDTRVAMSEFMALNLTNNEEAVKHAAALLLLIEPSEDTQHKELETILQRMLVTKGSNEAEQKDARKAGAEYIIACRKILSNSRSNLEDNLINFREQNAKNK